MTYPALFRDFSMWLFVRLQCLNGYFWLKLDGNQKN